ncbi:MAG: LamG domain-containing protein [Gaiella sp.]
MEVPNSPDFNYASNFAFEIWVNPGSHALETYRAIACNTLYPATGWLLGTNFNGGLIFQSGNGIGGQGWALTSTSLTANAWNHVAAVVESNAKKLYLNGVLMATGGGAGFASTQTLKLGYCPNALNPGIGFSYDHARIYQRALSATEVADHFNNPGAPASPAPISLWRLDEGSSSLPAADSQGGDCPTDGVNAVA